MNKNKQKNLKNTLNNFFRVLTLFEENQKSESWVKENQKIIKGTVKLINEFITEFDFVFEGEEAVIAKIAGLITNTDYQDLVTNTRLLKAINK